MTNPFKDRKALSQAAVIGLLTVVLGSMVIYRFTTQTPVEKARARAHIILQNIYQLEQTYFHEKGTYLPISRENNGEILNLNNVSGRFRYRVEADGRRFAAFAEADLNGNGKAEIWLVDPQHPDPILIEQD